MKNKIYTTISICIICAAIFTACSQKKQKEETVNETAVIADTSATVTEVKTDTTKGKEDTTKAEAKSSITPLTVTINNLKSPTAPVVVSFYTPKNKFLDLIDQKKYIFKPKNGKLSVKVNDLPYGEYAIAIFEDIDSDGKIGKNMLGIPTEPYAFSQNYKPKIHAPSFDDCKFSYNAKENSVSMTLLH